MMMSGILIGEAKVRKNKKSPYDLMSCIYVNGLSFFDIFAVG